MTEGDGQIADTYHPVGIDGSIYGEVVSNLSHQRCPS